MLRPPAIRRADRVRSELRIHLRTPLGPILAATTLAILAVACGSGGSESPPASAPAAIDPLPTLESAVAALATASSFHLDVNSITETSTDDFRLAVPFTFVGDIQRPDRFEGILTVTAQQGDVSTGLIGVAGTTYQLEPGADRWVIAEGNLADIGDPEGLVQIDPSLVTQLTLLREETIGGLPVFHFHGLVPGRVVGGDGELETDYWIGIGDNTLYRIRTHGTVTVPGPEGELLNVTLDSDIKLSNYGGRFDIEAPPIE